MKKFYFLLVFFIILSLQSKAFSYDCKLDKIKIDNSYESMELSPMFMVFNRHEDGTPALVAGPIESFCEESNETNGAMVQLLFIENKLARIIFETSTTNNRVLFKIANIFYKVGFRQEQIKIEKKENETYTVNKEDNLYFYGNYKKEKEFLEYFEITGHKYGEKINQLLSKQEN